MKVYLDTSVVVSLLVGEPGADATEAAVRGTGDALATSAWVSTEVASALSIKVRTGSLTNALRSEVTAAWGLWRRSFEQLPIGSRDFEAAERFAARHELALRSGDALHLALALSHGCRIATLDTRMADAARALGIDVLDLRS